MEEKTDFIVIPETLTAAIYVNMALLDHVVSVAYGIGPEFLFMPHFIIKI